MNMKDRIRLAYQKGYRVQEDGSVLSPQGTVRKLQMNPDGYKQFGINTGGRTEIVYVHRLAAYQKHGEAMFQEGLQVRHWNNDSSDNNDGNLLMGTQSQNRMDLPADVRHASACQAALRRRKLSDAQADALRADRRAGMTYKQLCAKYKITKGAVSYIVHEKTYKKGL